MKDTVLITGASGFVGASLQAKLRQSGYNVKLLVRQATDVPTGVPYSIGDVTRSDALRLACEGVGCVIHLAGRAHKLDDKASDPLAAFRRVNVYGTENLARASLAAGVKRFIFLSSIGVNGASTVGSPFTENARPVPHASYAVSKLEAEERLVGLTNGTSMETVIIRPPLVYAGHAPGNFRRILKLVASGLPLPLGAIENQRSLIALPNLLGFISLCISKPEAANELFLISDGIDVSIQEIVQYLALGMGVKARLWPIPASFLKGGTWLIRQPQIYTQLCDSLTIDSSKARRLLGWDPIITPQQALQVSGIEFRQMHGNKYGL